MPEYEVVDQHALIDAAVRAVEALQDLPKPPAKGGYCIAVALQKLRYLRGTAQDRAMREVAPDPCERGCVDN
ncbi:MAG: hypothetical protein AB7D47_04415 [Desulfovibrio sp.]|jgi:hypothetical protein